MYRNGGLIPRGPSGGNYTYVMIGDSAPFFAAAYSKGIRNYDINLAYEGLRKNALPGGIRDHAGYELGPNACGGGMKYYIERGYVPEGIGGSEMHKDGASMTLDYAYEDWCLAQLAKALGKDGDYQWLMKRSYNYANLWDPTVNYVRPRNLDGSWLADFSLVGPQGSFHTEGFCEANSAIYTYSVLQDLPGLITLFSGNEKFSAALNRQFELAKPANFVATPKQHGDAWVDYGNEPSYALAHLFNFAGAPWLSQKWVREVKDHVYSDVTPEVGYHDDDDEGKSSSVSALMAIGLFDVKGGSDSKPSYQLTAPIFDQITLHLSPEYFPGGTFTIITRNSNHGRNVYIRAAKLNGRPLNHNCLEHSAVVNGGVLELDLDSTPNREWGVQVDSAEN